MATKQQEKYYCQYMLTLNNPLDYGYTHEQIKKIIEDNFKHLQFYCLADEISHTGTPHTHLYILMNKRKRWSAVQRAFCHAHIEERVYGSPEQVVNYIKKEGEYISNEKKETSVKGTFESCGKLPKIAPSKSRNEILTHAEELLLEGLKPEEIMEQSLLLRQYETEIRKAFFANKMKNTPALRELLVYWHIGESGSGKSYSFVNLCEEYGYDDVFFANDYSNNGTALFSHYQGESVVILDEYKGGLPYSMILSLMQGYKQQIHCRYANVYALYSELHITSVLTPQEVFNSTISAQDRERDTVTQLLRRINYIVYHYKDNGEYKSYQLPMADFTTYDALKQKVHGAIAENNEFHQVSKDDSVPFN